MTSSPARNHRLRDAGQPRETATETYVKPAVLQLDFAVDLPVSMAQNCKTAQSTNVGSTPCRTQGGGRGCQTIGS